MFQVTLIRPGLTEFDRQHRIQGTLDLPLHAEGEIEIDNIYEAIRDEKLEILYCSPTNPAAATAERLGERLGIPVKELEGLANCDLGLWQGRTIEEIKSRYPKVYKQWRESPDRVCPPGGEANTESLERSMKSLVKPLKKETRFGLVVCEPLATLISCSLRGCKHELPAAYRCRERGPLVEKLVVESINGEVRATPVGSS
jgi:phosphoserine phosphatase